MADSAGDALLVSFGAFTVADKDGKAIVKERLALIEAVMTGSTAASGVGPESSNAGNFPTVPPPAPLVPHLLPKLARPDPRYAEPVDSRRASTPTARRPNCRRFPTMSPMTQLQTPSRPSRCASPQTKKPRP